ncbi:MAG TPA: long-chain fatty acid--CoA ligase [Thermodesulfobacteriota bacterium]|nr:long-chain fatty acid--CoA ligase [Thermodesulfobacteriota bacterium]
MNLAKLAEDRVKELGVWTSLIFEDREITNVEMARMSQKLGRALQDLGVRKGDRVILQMPNCPEVLQSFQAVWRIGAVVVPINYLVGEEEIAYIYDDSGAKVVISSLPFLPKIRAARTKVPGPETIILIDPEVPEGTVSYREIVGKSPEDQDVVETEDDDLATLIYTAGTTGRPKGVMHSHFSLYSNARMQFESLSLPDGMISVFVLPLCHSYGIASMNQGLFRRGGRAILLISFDVEAIFSSIQKYRANILAGVPTMYVFMLLYPEPRKYDLSSMKYWFCGSAPLALETFNRFKEVFGFGIIEGWGLTEAGANNSVNPPEGVKKVGSIGLPMKGMEMKVVDDEGKVLPARKEGEIVIRGPMLMKGYWNKPEETVEVLRGGWLHTGDIGYVDEDGYFWITDRKKDLIIKAGENISPRTIEEVLFKYPKVSEAAVIGIKDEIYGENIKAFVVLKPGQTATTEEVIEYCRAKLSNFLLPKEIVFLKALPKSLVGKVLKKELRKLKSD